MHSWILKKHKNTSFLLQKLSQNFVDPESWLDSRFNKTPSNFRAVIRILLPSKIIFRILLCLCNHIIRLSIWITRRYEIFPKSVTAHIRYLNAHCMVHKIYSLLSYCLCLIWSEVGSFCSTFPSYLLTFRCRSVCQRRTGTFRVEWGTKKGKSIWLPLTQQLHLLWLVLSQTQENSCSNNLRLTIINVKFHK